MHEFPQKIEPSSARDPETLNVNTRRTASTLRVLNEHNLAEGALVVDDLEDWCVTSFAVTRLQVDPGIDVPGGKGTYWPRNLGLGNPALEVQGSTSWQVVSSSSITTGEDSLLVVGWAQFACGAGTDGDESPWAFPTRAQFALAVDGTVLENTITGTEDEHPAPYELYHTDHTFKDYKAWDSRHVEWLPDANGIGKSCGFVRLMYSIPVAAGGHDVRIVARRLTQGLHQENLPTALTTSDVATWIRRDKNYSDLSANKLWIFNRGVAAVRVGGWQTAEDCPESDPSIPEFEDQDTLDEASLTVGNLERGAVIYDHFSGTLTDNVDDAALDTPHAVSVPYTTFGAPIGEKVLDVSRGGAGFDVSDLKGWVLILADVEVRLLEAPSIAGGSELPGWYAAVGRLVLESGGLDYNLDGSEAFLTGDVIKSADRAGIVTYPRGYEVVGGTIQDTWDSLPLVWVGSPSDLPVQTFDKVKVKVSVWNLENGSTDPVDAVVEARRLSIFRSLR